MRSFYLVSGAFLVAICCCAAEDGLQWGAPVEGLHMGIGLGPESPEPQLRLVFENAKMPEIDVPLGSSSDKGAVYDLEFTLTSPDGKKEFSLFNMNGPPGVQKVVQPIIAQLKQDFNVKRVEIDTDRIDDDVKVLLVIHPKGISDKTQYAITNS